MPENDVPRIWKQKCVDNMLGLVSSDGLATAREYKGNGVGVAPYCIGRGGLLP